MQNILRFPKKILSIFFPSQAAGLGAFGGVYVPSVLMMLGVILYLRLGWIAGQVGETYMIGIITISLLIMIMTAFSMTSITSNMPVGGGGAYYLISRSLGIELGGGIGIALYLCQCVSASLCVSGFAESIHNIYPDISIKFIEVGSLAALALLSFISTNLALSTQFLIFVCLGASFISIFAGSGADLPPPDPSNLVLPVVGFWGAFSMFYPAMTGIESGMAMSGNLKNPSRSLPLGIIASLLTVYVIYLALTIFLSHQVSPNDLRADLFIVYKIAAVPQLIMVGIWGATLSSALSCLLGGPRMLQAISEDGILPKIFSRTYGKQGEPRVAIITTFLIALTINFFSTINQIIPIVAMICLISYGCLNFVVYFEEILKNPSWRPSFRTPWPVSLIGGIACFGAMCMINLLMTFVGLLIVASIYLWVSRKNIHADWEDMRYSLLYFLHRKTVYRLAKIPLNPRNWRPNILAFAQSPISRENLIHFSYSLTQGKGKLVFASIFPDYFSDNYPLESAKKVFEDFLDRKKIPSLVEVCSLKRGYAGVRSLVEAYNFGILRPNTIILSSPEPDSSMEEFAKTLIDIHQQEKNILILRDQEEQGVDIFTKKMNRQKQIDIWWDGQNRLNLDLVLSLYSVLHKDRLWKKTQATINMIVNSDQAKDNLEEYFQTFQQKNHIQLDVKIYLFNDCEDPIEMISPLSQDADLVFMGLPAPEVEADYADYLEGLMRKTASLNNVAFVMHGENINLREMWNFET